MASIYTSTNTFVNTWYYQTLNLDQPDRWEMISRYPFALQFFNFDDVECFILIRCLIIPIYFIMNCELYILLIIFKNVEYFAHLPAIFAHRNC